MDEQPQVNPVADPGVAPAPADPAAPAPADPGVAPAPEGDTTPPPPAGAPM